MQGLAPHLTADVGPSSPVVWGCSQLKFPKKLTSSQNQLLARLESNRVPALFDQAACKGVEPETFQSDHPSRIAAAKRVCASCPILSDCLKWAIDNFEEGVWGGTTGWERQRLSVAESILDVDELAERRATRSRLEEDVAIRTLAEEFQVTERTIHRWKAQIQKEAS